MEFYIVSVGEEILEGSIVDTNSNFIARLLKQNGYKVNGIMATGDDIDRLTELFQNLSLKNAFVISTGGLGPTFDDNTTLALSKACNLRVKLNREVYFDIVKKVKAKGVELKPSHSKQAYLPYPCRIIKNPHGTAAGFIVKCNNAYFAALPGVPSEMKSMVNEVISFISTIIPSQKLFSQDIKLIGVPESDMDKFLKDKIPDDGEVILNAMEGELAVRIRAGSKEIIENLSNIIKKQFGYKVYSLDNRSIEDVLSETLNRLNLTIAFEETITAGYLAYLMHDKSCFVASSINAPLCNADADIIAKPFNLKGNEFELSIKFHKDSYQTRLRYMGNKNFMHKAIAKRTLGFIYQYLKENIDFSTS